MKAAPELGGCFAPEVQALTIGAHDDGAGDHGDGREDGADVLGPRR